MAKPKKFTRETGSRAQSTLDKKLSKGLGVFSPFTARQESDCVWMNLQLRKLITGSRLDGKGCQTQANKVETRKDPCLAIKQSLWSKSEEVEGSAFTVKRAHPIWLGEKMLLRQ
jgi:hypothetical protein